MKNIAQTAALASTVTMAAGKYVSDTPHTNILMPVNPLIFSNMYLEATKES